MTSDVEDAEFEVDINQHMDSEDDVGMSLADKPIYENANITLCGAYCSIIEFKRACHLSFSTIAMLFQLLQLLCPERNTLPRSVYLFNKFFLQIYLKY